MNEQNEQKIQKTTNTIGTEEINTGRMTHGGEYDIVYDIYGNIEYYKKQRYNHFRYENTQCLRVYVNEQTDKYFIDISAANVLGIPKNGKIIHINNPWTEKTLEVVEISKSEKEYLYRMFENRITEVILAKKEIRNTEEVPQQYPQTEKNYSFKKNDDNQENENKIDKYEFDEIDNNKLENKKINFIGESPRTNDNSFNFNPNDNHDDTNYIDTKSDDPDNKFKKR